MYVRTYVRTYVCMYVCMCVSVSTCIHVCKHNTLESQYLSAPDVGRRPWTPRRGPVAMAGEDGC